MNLLSAFDAAVLRSSRRVLTDLARAAYHAEPDADDRADAADTGRLAGVTDVAAGATFEVLNTAASYVCDERARLALRPAGVPALAEVRAELRALLVPPSTIERAREVVNLANRPADATSGEQAAAQSQLASMGAELAELVLELVPPARPLGAALVDASARLEADRGAMVPE